jgi:hypothetical protein
MAKTLTLSEETVRELVEAHATLSAWFLVLHRAVQTAGGTVRAPTDAERRACLERMAIDYPDVAEVVLAVEVPKLFRPRPLESPRADSDPSDGPVAIRFPRANTANNESASEPSLSERAATDDVDATFTPAPDAMRFPRGTADPATERSASPTPLDRDPKPR